MSGATAPAVLDDAALRAWPLPSLESDDDKEARGRVVVVAGSREIAGAALLSARAALRAGAGKVLIVTVEAAAIALAVALPEARVVGLPETPGGGIGLDATERVAELADRAGVLLLGPGMQDEDACCELAAALRARLPEVPLILDATAMGAVSRRPVAAGPVLITPHAGEMAHLTGLPKDDILAAAFDTAAQAAREWHAVVALKGARTVIAAPDGRAWLHEAQAVGLGTAGSGDVMAGLIAGFTARGAALEQAAAWGVALHARAGMRLARRVGGMGYLASELAAEIPALLDALSPADATAATPAARPPVPTDAPSTAAPSTPAA